MLISRQRATLFNMLICLTIIAMATQCSLFFIHYKTSTLLDTLVQSSLATQIWHKAILLPIIGFILVQLSSNFLFIVGVWFIATACGDFFKFSQQTIYYFGLLIWLSACTACITFNNLYFFDSFFSTIIRSCGWYNHFYNKIVFLITASILAITTFIAYYHFFISKQHKFCAWLFLTLISTSFALWIPTYFNPTLHLNSFTHNQPNIILIGLDSVRPDFVNYFNQRSIHTPNIDHFLQTATVFSNAYTPLARTFPAWMSILTAQYPKNNHARSNLADPALIIPQETLAKKLRVAGYQTFYATDEKRFSNIIPEYGFDHILGPKMGINDFLIGGLSDFPLTNLLINTPLGRLFFPYNYANRAAAITYEPSSFLRLVQLGLEKKKNDKPLFLAIHFCVSHWPFTWAHDKQTMNALLDQRYLNSVEEVDKQLGKLLQLLKAQGLLENSLLVLLSDHGTSLGLMGDRIIEEKNYTGEQEKLKWLPIFKSLTEQKNRVNTAYGQGTDVLSLTQHHVLMAFKGIGIKTANQQINSMSSLLDITPTILDYLNLPPLLQSDGYSFKNCLEKKCVASINKPSRPLFIETGYSITEIETDKISIEKTVKQSISTYQINPLTGLLYVSSATEKLINKNKQRAILMGDWLLAKYPDNLKYKLAPKPGTINGLILAPVKIPAFFVLVNIKTGVWTIKTPEEIRQLTTQKKLLARFNAFYRSEISQLNN